MRDARSDSYSLGYRRTVFRRESPLSKIERDRLRRLLIVRPRMLSRVGAWRVPPPPQPSVVGVVVSQSLSALRVLAVSGGWVISGIGVLCVPFPVVRRDRDLRFGDGRGCPSPNRKYPRPAGVAV